MRSLEVIESELAAAREALSNVEGTPAEVYSRIVGYYRSVRNWNKGKREEYRERVLFNPATANEGGDVSASWSPPVSRAADTTAAVRAENAEACGNSAFMARILLFVRPACPSCPQAKDAAGKLGLPVEFVDADTEDGLAEAVKRNVMSTPTAILLSGKGEELGRARDPASIGRLEQLIAV